jgi:hypothetical protein
MNEKRDTIELEATDEKAPAREPFFRRYQVKIRASVKAGPLPTGHPPIGY